MKKKDKVPVFLIFNGYNVVVVIGTQICNLVVALKQFLPLPTEENAQGNKCPLALTAAGPGALNWRLLH